jgi:hypothetical protein
VLRILYMFFWVFPRRHIVVVVGRRFGTLCQFHLPRLDVDSLVVHNFLILIPLLLLGIISGRVLLHFLAGGWYK